MFIKLPSNSEKLLNELVQTNNPTELLCEKVKAVTGKDEEELMGIIRELRKEDYIDVKWADDLPYIVILNNSARTYNEQLAEYERQLQVHQSKSPEKRNTNKERVAEFIQRGERIGKEEYHPACDGFPISYVAGPQYDQWMNEIKIFSTRYLRNHTLFEDIQKLLSNHHRNTSAYEDMMSYLRAIANDVDFWQEVSLKEEPAMYDVFISHASKDKLDYVDNLKNLTLYVPELS